MTPEQVQRDREALLDRLKVAQKAYEHAGVDGENGAQLMADAAAQITALQKQVKAQRVALTEIEHIAWGYNYSFETADHAEIHGIAKSALQQSEGKA